MNEGGRTVEINDNNGLDGNLTDAAVAHFQAVLKDPQASDTAKTSAANGLANIDRQRTKALAGTIHKLTRAELTQEIRRTKALLSGT